MRNLSSQVSYIKGRIKVFFFYSTVAAKLNKPYLVINGLVCNGLVCNGLVCNGCICYGLAVTRCFPCYVTVAFFFYPRNQRPVCLYLGERQPTVHADNSFPVRYRGNCRTTAN